MSLRWLLPQANPDVIRFTVTPTASAKTVTLENLTAPCNCFIDWGDGERSAQIVSATSVSHTYADTTPRRITIHGVLGGFWNSAAISVGKTLVTSVDEINSRSLVSLAHTFRGCTGLATLPATLDAPNIVDFSYAFYQCRSVTSALPALWLSHPNAAHAGCFTDCFKSLYGQYGTGCSSRQYVPSVAGQTYYQHYGQSQCPAATKKTTSPISYYQHYGGRSSCPRYNSSWYVTSARCYSCKKYMTCAEYLDIGGCRDSAGGSNTWGHTTQACTCPSCGHVNALEATAPSCSSKCSKVYQVGTTYYSCSYYGTNCKGSSCGRTYSSGSSAYYRCQKSNATCPTTNCPYPCANEADVNAAKAAGWA